MVSIMVKWLEMLGYGADGCRLKLLFGQHNSKWVPYFSAYKTEAFPVQNNPKNLDPSHKTDLDL